MTELTAEQKSAQDKAINEQLRAKHEPDMADRAKWEREHPGIPYGAATLPSIPPEEIEAALVAEQERTRQLKQDRANRFNADLAARNKAADAAPAKGPGVASVTSATLRPGIPPAKPVAPVVPAKPAAAAAMAGFPKTAKAKNGQSKVVANAGEEAAFLAANGG